MARVFPLAKRWLEGAVSALTFETVKSCFEVNFYIDEDTCIVTWYKLTSKP